ncbi:Reticulon [Corchorus capsularis]|uniref:Reticulon-like protein n=1 Tax=Corchorus capsularis TaxID=210143 RepID=A0A1R3GUF6_COCAP|nr:Reticulon [Corchorus capsularis]
MDLSSSTRRVKTSVVAGSVWETRMKNDEVKGGIKVFNGDDDSNVEENGDKRLSLKKGQTVVGVSGKRKTWKSESFDGNPIQIAKGKTEDSVDGIKKSPIRVAARGRYSEEQQCKDLSLSVDGIKKTPIRKGRSEGIRELSKSVDGIERSPIHMKKPRSEKNEGNSIQLRKAKSDSVKPSDQSGNGNGNEGNSLQLRKAKSEESKALVLVNEKKGNDVSIEENDKNPVETEKDGSEEICKEFGVCQEKSFDIKEMNVVNEVKKLSAEKPNNAVNEVKKLQEDKPSKVVVNEVRKITQFNNKIAPFSSTVNKQPPPVVKRATSVYTTTPAKPTKSTPYNHHYQNFPQTQNKLQNLVDLVMWRDVSKSALVFGMGTFIIISSSYTQDLNISCISVISYLGLVYLAAIFLYRSIICRGIVNIDESSCVLGEEEAVWLLKLFLPYLNEFLLKLRALFSGDPSTTMKLAVLLFVLARCGSSITIWKMAKLGFFGVFTVPKVCSSYSHQLTAYGKFWIRRFRDAWDSCTHKKAVAVGIFTLVWNLSSIVARIWAAFMLFVALRYYQQKMVTDDWVEEEVAAGPGAGAGPTIGETCQVGSGLGSMSRQRHGLGPSRVEANKVKKGS